MITMSPGKGTILLAREEAEEISRLRNSITSGKHTLHGRIGERAVHELIGGDRRDSFDYDILTPGGKRVEVKTTVTTVVPRPHYHVHICAHNPDQNCDEYVFVRVLKDRPYTTWVLGRKSRSDFFREATFRKKGDAEPGTGWTIREDSFVLPIRQLEEVRV